MIQNYTAISEARYLLLYAVKALPDGRTSVGFYKPSQATVLEQKPEREEIVERVRESFADRELDHWSWNHSTTERIVAELALGGQTDPFTLGYFCVGIETPHSNLDARVASFFVGDQKTEKPILSGCLDFPDPVTRERMEEFFPQSENNEVWQEWAHQSFRTEHSISPAARIDVGGAQYVSLYTEAKLYPYACGMLQGGLPIGDEDTFVAICDLEKSAVWQEALGDHLQIFGEWNFICRHEIFKVFIQGEPGAGKELWYEAVKGGVQARCGGKWRSMAATLGKSQLQALLYGEQQGNLERQGYLQQCEGGGVFLDEIGKSDPQFRADLLRVLEAREFVPKGGSPKRFKKILFVFASTKLDREESGSQPPDFWTRMEAELLLPPPIELAIARSHRGFRTALDRERFYALFATFWFKEVSAFVPFALQKAEIESETSTGQELLSAKKEFREQVFEPLVDEIALVATGHASGFRTKYVPVSPRRVRSLARKLAAEYRWRGSGVSPDNVPAARYAVSRRALIKGFVDSVVLDAENRDRA